MFRRERNVILSTLVFGLVVWVVDALIGSQFFYTDRSIPELLGVRVPEVALYERIFITICFMLFGFTVSRVVARQQRAEKALARAYDGLEGVVCERTEELRQANVSLRKHRDRLEELVDERTDEIKHANTRLMKEIGEHKEAAEALEKSNEQLAEMLTETVDALTSAAEVRDPYTAGHQRAVSELACAIAREMRLHDRMIDGIRIAGIVHDIGKISVPAEILSKPGALTENEYRLVHEHAQAGYDILQGIRFPWPVAETVLQHHERMDGSGYPNGLKGNEILLEARIIAVADTVEAMAAHRPYRPALGKEKALWEIRHDNGRYDGRVVEACVRILKGNRVEFSREGIRVAVEV